MKQLVIVKSSTALNGGASTPKDLNGMTAGSIGFFSLSNKAAWLSAAAASNFAIVSGRGANSPAVVIPEIDFSTLKITKTAPEAGVAFSAYITIPTPVAGKTYTLTLVKLGTDINERNKWTETYTVPKGAEMTAAEVATILYNGFKAKADTGAIPVTVSLATAKITITAIAKGEGWKLVAGDDLYGTSVTTTAASPTIGDKAYVQKLAQQCAGDKGFNYTDDESTYLYKGYPEEVEDLVPNTSGDDGVSTAGYEIINLRFATGREAGKQTDERIWQDVIIALPITHAGISTIHTILGIS